MSLTAFAAFHCHSESLKNCSTVVKLIQILDLPCSPQTRNMGIAFRSAFFGFLWLFKLHGEGVCGHSTPGMVLARAGWEGAAQKCSSRGGLGAGDPASGTPSRTRCVIIILLFSFLNMVLEEKGSLWMDGGGTPGKTLLLLSSESSGESHRETLTGWGIPVSPLE